VIFYTNPLIRPTATFSPHGEKDLESRSTRASSGEGVLSRFAVRRISVDRYSRALYSRAFSPLRGEGAEGG
jgi:hypothetical protein